MKNDYNIINIFSNNNEKIIKEKVNAIVKNLCVDDVEKISNLNYNTNVILEGDTSNYKKREVSG